LWNYDHPKYGMCIERVSVKLKLKEIKIEEKYPKPQKP
jgi:hypothetical protein